MPKWTIRITAVVLVSCLALDPALAHVQMTPALSFLRLENQTAFLQRALAAELASSLDEISQNDPARVSMREGAAALEHLVSVGPAAPAKSMVSIPAIKFLSILGLEDASTLRPNAPTDHRPDGSAIVRITIPNSASANLSHGLGILHHELAEGVDQFDLLYNPTRQLIGIFPVLSDSRFSNTRFVEKLRPAYFDISAYYFQTPRFGDNGAAEYWEAFAASWAEDQKIIKRYLTDAPFRMEPTGGGSGYYFAEANPSRGHLDVKAAPFNGPNPFLSKAIDEGAQRVLFPVLPTVFPPSQSQDHHYDLSLWGQSDDKTGRPKPEGLKEGDRVWVVGPGCGFDSWLASLVVKREIYLSGKNPFEIANTELFAELAGFKIKDRVFDNIADDTGYCAFPGQEFDWLIWNMPHLSDDNRSRRFGEIHDGDPEGLILQRFLWYLPDIPVSHKHVRIWNAAEDQNGRDMVNVILRMVQAAGLKGWVERIDGTCAIYTLMNTHLSEYMPPRLETAFKPFWPSDDVPMKARTISSPAAPVTSEKSPLDRDA